MTAIWTPTTNKEINDLTVKIEATNFEIKKIESRIEGVRIQLDYVRNYNAGLRQNIRNLKKKDTQIVSMVEYGNILGDIAKSQSVINDSETFIATHQNQITLMKKDIQLMRERIESLDNYRAEVLEFKPRGKGQ